MNVDVQWSGLDDLVRRIEGRAARAVERPLARATREVLRAAKAAWPVRTGRSRRALTSSVYLTTAGVVVEAACPVDYATDIHDGQTWRELVRDPLSQLGRQTGPDIERELVAVVEGRG